LRTARKTIRLPSPEMAGSRGGPWVAGTTAACRTAPVTVSLRYNWSPDTPSTRFEASDRNSTKRPSAVIVGSPDDWSPSTPAPFTLSRRVSPEVRSRRNTSLDPFSSSGTRLLANEVNTVVRPDATTPPCTLCPLPSAAVELIDMRLVVGD
jgi:hypothetical protein